MKPEHGDRTEIHKNGSTHLSQVGGPDSRNEPHDTEDQPKDVAWLSVLQIESKTPKDVEGCHEAAHACDHDQQTRIAGLESVSAAHEEGCQQIAEHHHAETTEHE